MHFRRFTNNIIYFCGRDTRHRYVRFGFSYTPCSENTGKSLNPFDATILFLQKHNAKYNYNRYLLLYYTHYNIKYQRYYHVCIYVTIRIIYILLSSYICKPHSAPNQYSHPRATYVSMFFRPSVDTVHIAHAYRYWTYCCI